MNGNLMEFLLIQYQSDALMLSNMLGSLTMHVMTEFGGKNTAIAHTTTMTFDRCRSKRATLIRANASDWYVYALAALVFEILKYFYAQRGRSTYFIHEFRCECIGANEASVCLRGCRRQSNECVCV